MGRRAVLAGVALLPLAACTSEPAPPPPPDPDDLLRGAAVERERALLAEHDRLLALLPALSLRLLPLRAEHAEHLLALTGPPPSGSPSPSASPTPAPPLTPGAVPTDVEALAALLAAEQAAAAGHTADALAAVDRDLAALLASLAASESSHAVALA